MELGSGYVSGSWKVYTSQADKVLNTGRETHRTTRQSNRQSDQQTQSKIGKKREWTDTDRATNRD